MSSRCRTPTTGPCCLAQQTRKEGTFASAGGDDVLGTLGLSTDGGTTLKRPLAAPQDAKIAIDGTTITRSSNTIADAIDGMTLNLFQADPGTTVTVEVDRSLSGVEDQIKSFADAYNALRDFTAVLVDRAPLRRHGRPEGGERLPQTGRTVDDEQ